MKHSILLCILALCSYACETSTRVSKTDVKASALPPDTVIEVIEKGQKLPEGATELGSVVISDGGFTVDCSYETVLAQAKERARKMGGNLVQITKHKKPSAMSTCHRIACKVYKTQGK